MKKIKWHCKDKFIKISKKRNSTIIKNTSDKEGKVFSFHIIRPQKKYVNIEYDARTLDGAGSVLSLVNRKRMRYIDFIQGSKSSSFYPISGFLLPVIIIKPHTTIEITNIEISLSDKPLHNYNSFLGKKRVLLITPSYPSPDNLYACGFVHTRVKAYLSANLEVEVAVINEYNTNSYYEIDGVSVFKTNYLNMKNILMAKSYDAILLHFLDSKYLRILKNSYLNETPVFIWNHGADILYDDYKEFYTPYFSNICKLPSRLKKEYKERDKYVRDIIKMSNVHWIFVSEWEKERAEELIKVKFNNSIVIHNYIDKKIFKYLEKEEEKRKKIFMVRRFDNTKKYAVDIVVLTILELSRRNIFNDLTFYICGEGTYLRNW